MCTVKLRCGDINDRLDSIPFKYSLLGTGLFLLYERQIHLIRGSLFKTHSHIKGKKLGTTMNDGEIQSFGLTTGCKERQREVG